MGITYFLLDEGLMQLRSKTKYDPVFHFPDYQGHKNDEGRASPTRKLDPLQRIRGWNNE